MQNQFLFSFFSDNNNKGKKIASTSLIIFPLILFSVTGSSVSFLWVCGGQRENRVRQPEATWDNYPETDPPDNGLVEDLGCQSVSMLLKERYEPQVSQSPSKGQMD